MPMEVPAFRTVFVAAKLPLMSYSTLSAAKSRWPVDFSLHIGVEACRQPCTKGVSAMSKEQPAHDVSKIEIEQQLREMNDKWVKALVRGDADTLELIMADDFLFAYPMEGDDKAQCLVDILSVDIRVEYLTRENISVRIWGATAVLTGKDSAKWSYKGREF